MIVYLEAALRDLREISRWYRKNRPAYEDRFFERLRATMFRIAYEPTSFPIIIEEETMRRARVLRSPYFVAFMLFRDRVHVVGVMHGAQDPKRTARRLCTHAKI
jgi:plasmid stabilization system protein ParE